MPSDLRFGPGSVIGILGGGQLGRMTALAAAQLGYRCHIFCPEADCPAAQVTPLSTTAAYDNEAALATFADQVDLVTFEFENIPFEAAAFLAPRVPLRPDAEVLKICQNRLLEKNFCSSVNVPTADYAAVSQPSELAAAVDQVGRPAILKTAEFGYDGKGQVAIGPDTDLAEAWQGMARHDGEAQAILEAFVDFRLEISVIVARSLDGTCRAYPAVENQHRDHILDQTIAPARIDEAIAHRAEAVARHLTQEIDLVGLMAVEMFVTGEDEVLVNELAPRPHNSGHWTLDACTTSQFEQHVRAVAGLPLGDIELHGHAVMKNLLGDEVDHWPELVAEPAAKLHLYGKAEARPGRKMGHVTRFTPKT